MDDSDSRTEQPCETPFSQLTEKARPIRRELHRVKNSVVPLVGSGTSQGIPSWSSMLSALSEELAAPDRTEVQEAIREADYLIAAELIAASPAVGLEGIRAFIKEHYQRPTPPRPPIYDFLAKLPCDHFLTTNYDPWLADAVTEHRGRPRVVTPFDPGALSDIGVSSLPLVLHLHGVAERPETCVLTFDQYAQLTEALAFRMGIEGYISQRHLLLIGHSGMDPDLQALLQSWSQVLAQGHPPRHWMLNRGMSMRHTLRLKRLGVATLDYGDHSVLPDLIRWLASDEIVEPAMVTGGVDSTSIGSPSNLTDTAERGEDTTAEEGTIGHHGAPGNHTPSGRPPSLADTSEEALLRLDAAVGPILTASVDFRGDVDERVFWRDIHVRREELRHAVVSSLQSPSVGLIYLTGRGGSGKTTLALDCMRIPNDHRSSAEEPPCNGVRLDFSSLVEWQRSLHVSVSRDSRSEALSPEAYRAAVFSELHHRVAQAFRQQILHHLLTLEVNPRIALSRFRLDNANRPFLDLVTPDRSQFQTHLEDASAGLAAIVALTGQGGSQEEALLRSAISWSECQNVPRAFEARFKLLKDYLRFKKKERDRLLFDNEEDPLQIAKKWILCYTRFFDSVDSVLVMDNCDFGPTEDSIRLTIEYGRMLSSAISHSSSLESTRQFTVMIVARDHTLRALDQELNRSRSTLLAVSDPRYAFMRTDSAFCRPLSPEGLARVLERRIDAAGYSIPLELVEQYKHYRSLAGFILMEYYSSTEQGTKGTLAPHELLVGNLRQTFWSFHRITLNLLRDSTTPHVIKNWPGEAARCVLRHRVLTWMLREDLAIREFARLERHRLDDTHAWCQQHRVVLTYLYNRKGSRERVTLGQLRSAVSESLGYPPDSIVPSIESLSHHIEGPEPFVSINEAAKGIEWPNDDAEICITQRGRLLIEKVVPTLEYCGLLAHAEPPNFFSLDAQGALDYLRPIVAIVEQEAEAELRNRDRIISEGLDSRAVGEFLTIENEAHACRAAADQLKSIRAFLWQQIQPDRPASGAFPSDDVLLEALEEWRKEPQKASESEARLGYADILKRYKRLISRAKIIDRNER